jgi:hypothetical protein
MNIHGTRKRPKYMWTRRTMREVADERVATDGAVVSITASGGIAVN